MNIYVYQIGDKDYRAELCAEFHGKEGRVVEVWPVNNDEEIGFVASHGSAFYGVSRSVARLADEAMRMLKQNGTYTKEQQKDIFNQKDLRERSDLLDEREQQLAAVAELNKENEARLNTRQKVIDGEQTGLEAWVDSIKDDALQLDQREQTVRGQEKLLDAHLILMDQREFSTNREENKLLRKRAEFLSERDKLLRFNEARTLDLDNRVKNLDIREQAIADIEQMSFFGKVKTVFRRRK